MTPDLLDDPRITATGLFAEAFTGLTARMSEQFAEHGVSLIEFEVLIRLARSPGQQLRMTDLAAQTSLSTSGVTRVVDRLERSGLVCRSACPTDRRSSFAVLTAAGQARLADVLPGHLALIDRWFTGLLRPEQLAALLDGLRTVRDAVRPGATAGAVGDNTPTRR
ncbi:MAG TPA: MarR family transcriptional regulator [Micromonosporaceae bacterium]|nr:MarR family transcriptional regulator [Micromonosporaceae bacterium]